MIKTFLGLLAIVLLYGVVGAMDQADEERQAEHEAQRAIIIAERKAELAHEKKWAFLLSESERMTGFSGMVARK